MYPYYDVVPVLMKDQSPIEDNEQDVIKWNRAVDLFIESVHKPDSTLRGCAYNQKCFDELMQVRENVLKYLDTLRSQ